MLKIYKEGEAIPFSVSVVGKAEGNRLKLTYGIYVLYIKGKNTNISPRKTGSVVEISFQGDVSELQTVPKDQPRRSRSTCERASGLSDLPDLVLMSSAVIWALQPLTPSPTC